MSLSGFRERWAADRDLVTPPLARMDVHVFRAPIDAPVRTSFGTMTDRPAVLVCLTDEDGVSGWGEIWCNYPVCGAEHRARLAVQVFSPHLLGHSFANPPVASDTLAHATHVLALQTREAGPLDQVIAGIDGALWDLTARRRGCPLWQVLGGKDAQAVVPVYASGINPGGAVESIREARRAGYRAFKIKIGFDPEQDLATVAAASRALAGNEHLMVDANQAWTPDQARAMALALGDFPLQWLEEPMPVDTPTAAWRELAAMSPVDLAGGENFASDEAFAEASDDRILSVLQPDLCKWGGISRCVPVAERVLMAGRQYCPHYLGGGIGLIASAHALAAVGGDGLLEVDCNPNPLRTRLAEPFPRVSEGEMPLPDGPGLGVEPDLEAVSSWQTLHLTETVARG